jgi:cell division protein FtsQ
MRTMRDGKRTARRKPKWAGAEAQSAGSRIRVVLSHPILLLTLGFLVLGSVGGVLAGGYIAKAAGDVEAAFTAPFTGAGFVVRDIAVTGQERTAPEVSYRALAIRKGVSIFGVDPKAVRARLLTLPWVADAEVKRHFPDTVSVRLIEKRPFALWKDSNGVWIIERSGATIIQAGAKDFGRLPLVMGAGAPETAAPVIDALSGERATEARLQAIERIGERRWDLHLAGGVTVRLPEDGWRRQIEELERLIVDKGVLERDIETIDLRYPDNYVFRLHNGDSRPVPRERRA